MKGPVDIAGYILKTTSFDSFFDDHLLDTLIRVYAGSERNDVHILMSRGSFRAFREQYFMNTTVDSTKHEIMGNTVSYKLGEFMIHVRPFPGIQEAMIAGANVWIDLSYVGKVVRF